MRKPESRFQKPKKKEQRTLERGTLGVRLTAAMPVGRGEGSNPVVLLGVAAKSRFERPRPSHRPRVVK